MLPMKAMAGVASVLVCFGLGVVNAPFAQAVAPSVIGFTADKYSGTTADRFTYYVSTSSAADKICFTYDYASPSTTYCAWSDGYMSPGLGTGSATVLGGGQGQSWTIPKDALSAGNRTVRVWAYDLAGNVSAAKAITINVTAAATPVPDVTAFSSNASTGTTTTGFTYSVTTSLAAAKVCFTYNSTGTWCAYSNGTRDSGLGTSMALNTAKTSWTIYGDVLGAGNRTITAKAYNADGAGGNTKAISINVVDAGPYTVTFNSNGGSAVASRSVNYGVSTVLPAVTRTGFTFLGWSTSSAATSASVPANAVVTVLANVTYYAVWQANTYTVSFNSMGGSAVASKTVTAGVAFALPAAPTRTGYTFAGWSTSSATSGSAAGASVTVYAATTYYATWKANTYTVTFNSMGGSTVASKTVTAGVAFALPAAPTRTGYAFAGWSTSSSATSGSAAGASVTVYAATTYYATWKINTYTVTYDSAGGSAVAAQSATFGAGILLPAAPTRTGYAFQSWVLTSTGANFAPGGSYVVSANVTFLAQWTANTYTVTFNSLGGSAVASRSVNYGVSTVLPAVTRTGFTFLGWSTSSTATSASVPANAVVMVLGNVTYYAVWQANAYTVSFNSMGGSAVASKTVTAGVAFALPATPTRTGYTFAGWSTSSSATSGSAAGTSVTVYAATTYYATWKANTYTVTFDSAGGSPVPAQVHTAGVAFAMPAAPVLTGFVFLGWLVVPADGGAVGGGSEASPGAAPGSSQTVYGDAHYRANWARACVVTFDSNGGTPLPSTVTPTYVKCGGTIGLPGAPSRWTYTFEGWSTDSSAANGSAAGASVKVISDITYYATWAPTPINITFDANGASGTVPPPAAVQRALGVAYFLLPSVGSLTLDENHYLAGWNTMKDGSGMSFLAPSVYPYTESVAGIKTLYAVWKLKTYTVNFMDCDGSAQTNSISASVGSPVIVPGQGSMQPPEGKIFHGWTALAGTYAYYYVKPSAEFTPSRDTLKNTYIRHEYSTYTSYEFSPSSIGEISMCPVWIANDPIGIGFVDRLQAVFPNANVTDYAVPPRFASWDAYLKTVQVSNPLDGIDRWIAGLELMARTYPKAAAGVSNLWIPDCGGSRLANANKDHVNLCGDGYASGETPGRMYETALHEWGHVLDSRVNYQASADYLKYLRAQLGSEATDSGGNDLADPQVLLAAHYHGWITAYATTWRSDDPGHEAIAEAFARAQVLGKDATPQEQKGYAILVATYS